MVRGSREASLERGSLRDSFRRRCHLVFSAQGGRGQGAQCPTKAVREVWTDTAPGEDAADGIRAVRGEEREATREETGNLQLPRPNAHLRPQPEGEVHSARKDDRETVP